MGARDPQPDSTNTRELAPRHREVLEKGSAISPEVIGERGYWSAHRWQDLMGIGLASTQNRPDCLPALVIPCHGPDGAPTYMVVRYDRPRTRKNGDVIKYEQPRGIGLRLDVPRRCVEGLRDPDAPLWWTEGTKKVDALASVGLVAVNTPGVDGWRSPSAIPDLFGIPLRNRPVVCAYDSDVLSKPAVRRAVRALGYWMIQKGAGVEVLDWTRAALPEGSKTGVDDFLAMGGDRAALDALRVPFDDWLKSQQSTADSHPREPYAVYGDGLARVKWYFDRELGAEIADYIPLTNFVAAITADVAHDDGVEVRRVFELTAELRGQVRRFSVPASQFATLNWTAEHLGAGGIVYPGQSNREHARTAMQLLSGDIPERRVYTHLGWRRINGEWMYLHAGGAITAADEVPGVEIHPPTGLASYTLPAPPSGAALVEAVRASLAVLRVAPAHLTVPLQAAIYRAPLGTADFSEHLSGPSGYGKSELAALAQQHYGAGMDARHLPGAWSSTGNALEALAFGAKDALLVIDDFVPTGDRASIARLHRDADRVLRAQGNNSGRARMRADGTLVPAKSPRGLIVSTGEDAPRGESLGARLLALEVGKTDVDWAYLTHCQCDAANGLYTQALAGYLRWLAPQYSAAQQELQRDTSQLRQVAIASAAHRRTPSLVASLAAAWRIFLRFALETGAISEAEARDYWESGWSALARSAAAQAQQQAVADPTRRFVALLLGALASGRAHVAGPTGQVPGDASGWGWRLLDDGSWRPQGERVGWLAREDLYLEPEASYAVVQRLADAGGEALPVSRRALQKRLKEQGLLLSTEPKRGALTVRRVLDGLRRDVLHLRAASLESPQPDQPDQSDDKIAGSRVGLTRAGRVSWSGDGTQVTGPDQRPRPADGGIATETPVDGQVGRVGRVTDMGDGLSGCDIPNERVPPEEVGAIGQRELFEL
jgi:hypothetical protein